jgi:hypothetical protein
MCVAERDQLMYKLEDLLRQPWPRKLFISHPSTTRRPADQPDTMELDFATFKKLMIKADCEIFEVAHLPGRYVIGWSRTHPRLPRKNGGG